MYRPRVFVCSFVTTDLYLEEPESWLVRRGAQEANGTQLHEQASLLWLPLLERDFPTFRAHVLAGLLGEPAQKQSLFATFPLLDLLRVGLSSPSAYWLGLALAWVQYLPSKQELSDQLLALYKDHRLPQHIRHHAKRCYFT
jgi:hypothetical protein